MITIVQQQMITIIIEVMLVILRLQAEAGRGAEAVAGARHAPPGRAGLKVHE